MTEPLTHRQAQMLEFLRGHFAVKHYAPYLKEMRAAINNKGGACVYSALRGLAARGLLTWERGAIRTIRLTSVNSGGSEATEGVTHEHL